MHNNYIKYKHIFIFIERYQQHWATDKLIDDSLYAYPDDLISDFSEVMKKLKKVSYDIPMQVNPVYIAQLRIHLNKELSLCVFYC